MKPITILELVPGRCACLVPIPGIWYCGAPTADNPFRMCKDHANAYLTKAAQGRPTKVSHKGLKPRRA